MLPHALADAVVGIGALVHARDMLKAGVLGNLRACIQWRKRQDTDRIDVRALLHSPCYKRSQMQLSAEVPLSMREMCLKRGFSVICARACSGGRGKTGPGLVSGVCDAAPAISARRCSRRHRGPCACTGCAESEGLWQSASKTGKTLFHGFNM